MSNATISVEHEKLHEYGQTRKSNAFEDNIMNVVNRKIEEGRKYKRTDSIYPFCELYPFCSLSSAPKE